MGIDASDSTGRGVDIASGSIGGGDDAATSSGRRDINYASTRRGVADMS